MRDRLFNRGLFALLLLFVQVHPAHAQNNAATEVIIIGTVHNGNRYVNYNTLNAVLRNLRPDVIFWEYSSEFRPIKGLLTYAALGANLWEEQVAIQKYLRRNPATLVLPYDTTFDRRTYLNSRRNRKGDQ